MASQTDIAIIGGGPSAIHSVVAAAKEKGLKVTVCQGCPFLEFTLAATYFLSDSTRHSQFLCGNPEDWKVKGVDYIFDKVTQIIPEQKVIKFASKPDLTYKAVIVATGHKLPLFSPTPGQSFEARKAEVERVSSAIAQADHIVIYGGGAVGLEMAGDVRAKHKDKKVTILSKDGGVLTNSHPPAMQEKVKGVLQKMQIEVVKGTAPPDFLNPKLESGSVQLDSGSTLSYGVFIPSFWQGPNTEFLAGTRALDAQGKIDANECLQCKAHPEIFGVAITSVPLLGHNVIPRLEFQAHTCAKNAINIVKGQPVVPHKDGGTPPVTKVPMSIKIGTGAGAYMIWDPDGLPPPAKLCCCLPCGGGFPCCPPCCCWCCAPGCAFCCGTCCGPPEGEASAKFAAWMSKQFMSSMGMKGAGKAPSQQVM